MGNSQPARHDEIITLARGVVTRELSITTIRGQTMTTIRNVRVSQVVIYKTGNFSRSYSPPESWCSLFCMNMFILVKIMVQRKLPLPQ